MPTSASAGPFDGLIRRIEAAATDARRPGRVRLLAVSKTRTADEVALLFDAGQAAFGENYVQEALAKQKALADRAIEWHLIGPLQSNKCREAAAAFDWIQSVDRAKLLPLLDRHRPAGREPLNLLIQVNIDDEASKSGCRPDEVIALAGQIEGFPNLRLRGLMAIPAPHDEPAAGVPALAAMRTLFERLREAHPSIDTLSMGMSDDFELAIAQGATMVRIGSALFGPRRHSL